MDVDDFAENGYVKIEAAAPHEVAEAAQRELWTRIRAGSHRDVAATPRFMAQAPVLLAEPLTPCMQSPLGSAWRR